MKMSGDVTQKPKRIEMSGDESTPKLKVVEDEIVEQLDADEEEFKNMRHDLPGIKGASAVGIVTIAVAKNPGKNEFFRTHPDFRPVVAIVDHEVDLEKQYVAVTKNMLEPLAGIGITASLHTLYLTVTAKGSVRIIPVRCADESGTQNEYARTKEIGLRDGIDRWVRLYTDKENHSYRVYPAPAGRFPDDPNWPELEHAKIFRLGFRDKGLLMENCEHPLFLKWSARDTQ
jgi:hypothetical protein